MLDQISSRLRHMAFSFDSLNANALFSSSSIWSRDDLISPLKSRIRLAVFWLSSITPCNCPATVLPTSSAIDVRICPISNATSSLSFPTSSDTEILNDVNRVSTIPIVLSSTSMICLDSVCRVLSSTLAKDCRVFSSTFAKDCMVFSSTFAKDCIMLLFIVAMKPDNWANICSAVRWTTISDGLE